MTFMRVLLANYRTKIHRQIRKIALNSTVQVAGMRRFSDKSSSSPNSLEVFLKEELRESAELPQRVDPPVGWSIKTFGTKFTLENSKFKPGALTVEIDTAESYELLNDEPEEEEDDQTDATPSRYPLLKVKHVNNDSTIELDLSFDNRDSEDSVESGAVSLAILKTGETVVINKILITSAKGEQLYCGEEYADPELWSLMWQKIRSFGVNEAFLEECIKINELHDAVSYNQFLQGVLNHFRN